MTTSEQKIVNDPQSLDEKLAQLKRPIVFTNGCFDILHRGHVTYLEEAANLGNSLVVGVNSDDSMRRLGKSADRPLNPLDDRMAILAALESVSLVVPFEAETPLDLIRQVQPDHLVKGGDWSQEYIVGADVVTGRGGQVHSLPFKYSRSTTSLIDRIRGAD
ncbi:MAG: D-glycero-beta-D-manno-heptose 1-phosphate adenylyltransferase [Acidiferrobacterales bacterium]